jgi:hypothetical protein
MKSPWSKVAVIAAASVLLFSCSGAQNSAPIVLSPDRITFAFFFTEG